ncbi:hypothetical protein COW36_07475 [bacterium (Candidatus Blackallbacteria) CG17_big_fil_post_rev_8_21_14_2_50_48_46]|uniref:Uncharacterized protein n=1 Tax=bacterium (Candidatus Blackallbacteria) CG17_big_fil_post_rev_8_21_14_2_50_48_46 TaxID=2014261 RepID=A0A2M7G7R1_9BACT|nr:MAG: hypothetical protein COW64_16575 [bacterium (Candidatus Blackallbacteria) CG18_big_fil_WC_8_21_14_2_50_49_26]PIW17776.1 MAG: hypothetical protein COW36_07475 [bacterium (Candidatus Blackallbacteria) CG17_big_fil_post_rev_8_21_14_2_50_48_46]PIW47335.1 MAG: hypothetical protein COW20_13000 [bacterium (Candidatus Blackallbacteria) CG13_big_fil_rev_8_21_14_2_50_49_14]
MSLQQYEFLEKIEHYTGQQDPYSLPDDVQNWIVQELEKRLQVMLEKYPELPLEIFRTLRTWQNLPIFIIGFRKEDQTWIKEAWHYGIKPAPEGAAGIQLVLDRVPVKHFQENPGHV